MTVAVEIDLLSPQVFGLKKAFSLKLYCQSEGKYCSCMYTFVFTLSLTADNCSNCGVCSLCAKRRRSRTVSWQSTSIQMVSLFAVYSFILLQPFLSLLLLFFTFLYHVSSVHLSVSHLSHTATDGQLHCLCMGACNNLFLFQSLKLSVAWCTLYCGVLHKY